MSPTPNANGIKALELELDHLEGGDFAVSLDHLSIKNSEPATPTPTPQPHPAQHAPPQHQQAEGPSASDTAPQTLSPSAAYHRSPGSRALCNTCHTASPPEKSLLRVLCCFIRDFLDQIMNAYLKSIGKLLEHIECY